MRLRLVPKDTKWDFFGWSKVTLGASFLAVIASVVLAAMVGLNFGIDFRGGTMIRSESAQAVDVVFGNRAREFESVMGMLKRDQCVVDLVRISEEIAHEQYEGICW